MNPWQLSADAIVIYNSPWLINTIMRLRMARTTQNPIRITRQTTSISFLIVSHPANRASHRHTANLVSFANIRCARQGTNSLRVYIIGGARPPAPPAREVTTARFLRNPSIAIAGLRDRARVPRWNLTGMSTFSGFDFTVERESTCVVATGQTGQLLSQHCPCKVIVVTPGQEWYHVDWETSCDEVCRDRSTRSFLDDRWG